MSSPEQPPVAPPAKKPGRKPGRPPKNRLNDILVKTHGIVESPSDQANIIEMVYENPTLFRKLFALYKAYDVNEISWHFYPDHVMIPVIYREPRKISGFIKIDARMLVKYYCKEYTVKTIKREFLDRSLRNMNKNHSQISFVLREEDKNSTMHIIVHDSETGSDMNTAIDLIPPEERNAAAGNNDLDYPLKFTLPSKHFKKLIQDIGASSQVVQVEKHGDDPLLLTYPQKDKIHAAGVYRDPAKIKLFSKLQSDESFFSKVSTKHVQPFSNSNIGDEVSVAADQEHPLSLTSEIGKKSYTRPDGTTVEGYVCTVKIYIELMTN